MSEIPSVSIPTGEKFTLRSAAPPREEIDRPIDPPKKRGGKIGRIAMMLSAAALAAACTSHSPAPVDASPTNKPPGVEQTQNTLPSVEDTINKLKNDPEIQNQKDFSLTTLRSQYTDSDFKDINGYQSAPVLEITYDKPTKSLRFQDKTPNGLNNQDKYNLLSPLLEAWPLYTAFETGKLDHSFVQLNKTNTDPILDGIDQFDGVFFPGDKSKGEQKKLFVNLPGNNELNRSAYKSIFTHEPMHALTADYSLSEEGALPTPEDFAQWQEVCVDIRDIAVDQAEKHSQDMLQKMQKNRNLFTDPKTRAAFDEVYNALRNGDFNKYEPKTGDNISNFSAEIPECRVIGPWPAFIRLIVARGIDMKSIDTDAIGTLAAELHDDWESVLENSTIFTLLQEGLYDQGAKDTNTLRGHSYDNWDELIVSTTNIVISVPETFATVVKDLETEQQKSMLALVDTAVKTLDSQVPQDQLDFHINLRTHYEIFKDLVTK